MDPIAVLAEPIFVSVIFAFVCAVCHLLDRKRTPKPGHCRVCDYDLRASKHRCPECGHPMPAGAASSGPHS